MDLKLIISDIENFFHSKVLEYKYISSGANADIYRIDIAKPPFKVAVKICKLKNLIQNEYETIQFISDRVDCKLPELYYFKENAEFSYFVMEYFEGTSCDSKDLLFRFHKRKLSEQIVDNLIKIQTVKNDKFGSINNAVYNTWLDYYSVFADEILAYTESVDNLNSMVLKAVRLSYAHLEKILSSTQNAVPTLIHGDYWAPNFIIDKGRMELIGVVDPFNVLWAEPEYELFCLTVGAGKALHLYEIYKEKVSVSPFCDLKVELYSLYNELLWQKKGSNVYDGYLVMRSKRLLKQMKKSKLI